MWPVYFAYIISAVCLWVLLSAILLNFVFARKSVVKVKKEKKSVVETGSMLAFFILTFVLGVTNVGRIFIGSIYNSYFSATGALIIVVGTAINIIGRFQLKSNWGNQIRIYENHTLVTTGIYKYIRHPLYSSTILMIFGSSFLFANPLIFALNTVVFLPFMVYRAWQEDSMLLDTFGSPYAEYKLKTGMLIPKRRKEGNTK